ncbi:DNA methyltransferase [Psychrobacter celer]|uniref:DNA methyltransferase n=1 Tax=Psychrobacter celer TaxID=306572 RepID=UPI003FCF9142
MAVNQADILNSLEANCAKLNHYDDKKEFFYDFLHAYGLPKNTITLLRKGDASRSVGLDGDVALNRKIYFKEVEKGADLEAALANLLLEDVITKNKIRFAVVTDFETLLAHDIDADDRLSTEIELLPKQYAFFLPLAGYEKAIMFSEHPADIRASEKMGRLFDQIKQINDLSKPEDIHALNVFLTRLLFCYYAEDTGLFKEGQFTSTIKSVTQEDGCDLSSFLTRLFYVLNRPDSANTRNVLPAHYTDFPYVNGSLFAAAEPVPEFNGAARKLLIDCGTLDWSEINPDIFGSMFQAVVDTEQRGNLGQHYTSVTNIMRVIQPLAFDGLYEDLEKARKSETKLQALLERISRVHFFDPCCGSFNFGIIAYKELRRFEMAVMDALNDLHDQNQMYFSSITLDQFYGIEIDDFAAEIAVLSLWIAEHQMNNAFKEKFGHAPASLPLGKAGNILCANSLRVDWREFCPKADANGKPYEVYLCGNPPFLGNAARSSEQLEDMDFVLSTFKSNRKVDYIATFFWKGAQYIQDGGALAFVSTNSICQGVQPSILWQPIFDLGIDIDFAYQSFSWTNNAKDKAAVHVVIIGLNSKPKQKTIYKEVDGVIQKSVVKNISPYLTDGSNLAVNAVSKPLCEISPMVFGSMANDGGNLLMTYDEKEVLVNKNPSAAKWVKQFMGASEFIKNNLRYCLWLVDATPEEIKSMPLVENRVQAVKDMRLASNRSTTRNLSSTPHLFGEIRQPKSCGYIAFPQTSSERREYIPIGFMDSNVIASSKLFIIPNGSFYEFGVLTSTIHKTWLAAVGGRMKSDYSYSSSVVYNTFPWAETTKPQRDHIEALAKEVLLTREDYVGRSLAELYDPDKMPDSLRAAHKALDLAVDKLYRDAPFRDNTERLEHLFGRYEKLIAKEKAGE